MALSLASSIYLCLCMLVTLTSGLPLEEQATSNLPCTAYGWGFWSQDCESQSLLGSWGIWPDRSSYAVSPVAATLSGFTTSHLPTSLTIASITRSTIVSAVSSISPSVSSTTTPSKLVITSTMTTNGIESSVSSENSLLPYPSITGVAYDTTDLETMPTVSMSSSVSTIPTTSNITTSHTSYSNTSSVSTSDSTTRLTITQTRTVTIYPSTTSIATSGLGNETTASLTTSIQPSSPTSSDLSPSESNTTIDATFASHSSMTASSTSPVGAGGSYVPYPQPTYAFESIVINSTLTSSTTVDSIFTSTLPNEGNPVPILTTSYPFESNISTESLQESISLTADMTTTIRFTSTITRTMTIIPALNSSATIITSPNLSLVTSTSGVDVSAGTITECDISTITETATKTVCLDIHWSSIACSWSQTNQSSQLIPHYPNTTTIDAIGTSSSSFSSMTSQINSTVVPSTSSSTMNSIVPDESSCTNSWDDDSTYTSSVYDTESSSYTETASYSLN